jgi:hypothetical protein
MSNELKVLGLAVGLVFTACAEDDDPDFGGAGGTTGGATGGTGVGGADAGPTGGAPSGGAPSGGAPAGGETPTGGAPSPNDAAVVGGVPAPQDAGPPVGGANDGGPPPVGGSADAGPGPGDAAGGVVSVDAEAPVSVPFGGPCAADDECAEGFICRRVGMGGDVCTQACEADETCPEGSQGQKCNNMGLCRP